MTPSLGGRPGTMGTEVERPVLRPWDCQQRGQTGICGLPSLWAPCPCQRVVPGQGQVAESQLSLLPSQSQRVLPRALAAPCVVYKAKVA